MWRRKRERGRKVEGGEQDGSGEGMRSGDACGGERGRGEDQARTKGRTGQEQTNSRRTRPEPKNKDRTPEQERPERSGVPGRRPEASRGVPGRASRGRPGTPRDASWQRFGGFPASAVGARRHEPSGVHHALRRVPITARRERNGRTRTKPCTHQAAAMPHSIPTASASAQDRRQVALKARAGERVPRPCVARGRGCGAIADATDTIPKTISQGRVALGHHRRHADRPTLRPPPAIASNAQRTAGACGYDSPRNRRCSPADGVAQVHERNARCVRVAGATLGARERLPA